MLKGNPLFLYQGISKFIFGILMVAVYFRFGQLQVRITYLWLFLTNKGISKETWHDHKRDCDVKAYEEIFRMNDVETPLRFIKQL